jgi:hypothetical protein
MDFSNIEGDYVKALLEYYDTNIRATKDDIERSTPEGVLKAILNDVAHELAGLTPVGDREYINSASHKYTNEIKYDPETGAFWLDALHIKVFMEEILIEWNISAKQIHGWVKSCFGIGSTNRTRIKLGSSSVELIRELKTDASMKIYTYPFNIKTFIPTANRFTTERPAEINEAPDDLF